MAQRSTPVLALLFVLATAACGSVSDTQPDGGELPDGGATDVTLTITRSGNGTGTVTSSPAGLDCGTTCTLTVPAGTVVTLSATPASDAVLAGWTGGGCTGTGTCELTLDADTTIDAKFDIEEFAVTVSRIGGGSGTVVSTSPGIDCGSDCTESYPAGTSVTLTATAAAGSTFVGWAGGGCTGADPCTRVVTEAVAVEAAFAMNNALVVAKTGNGSGTVTSPSGIDCGNDCMEVYAPGTTVTLTATPANGSVFGGWSGACTGPGTCTVTVNAATMVTATFTIVQFKLSLSKHGNGTGTVTSNPAGIDCGGDCDHLYNYPTPVTLTATPSADSEFTGWGGLCTGTAPCTLAMTANVDIMARFMLKQYTMTIVIAGDGAGTVGSNPGGISCGNDCTHDWYHGTPVTLTAAPMTHSEFVGWSGGGCTGTGPCTVTMTAATTVTATFKPEQRQLTVTKMGNGAGTVTSFPAGITCGSDCTQAYNYGTDVTLNAVPAAGSYFAGWSGACSGTGLACNLDMMAPRSAVATFQPRGVLYTIRQNDDMLRRLDPVTLQYTDIGPLGVDYSFGDCAWNTANNILYMVPSTAQILYRVNTTTGAATTVGVHGIAQLRSLAFHPPSGQLYAVGTGEHLYRINPSTADATFVGTMGITLDGMAWDPKRNRMVGLEANINGGTLYTVNLTTGAATQLAAAGAINNAGLAYDPVIDRFWAVDNDGKLLEYDPNANMARASRGTLQGQQTCITYRP